MSMQRKTITMNHFFTDKLCQVAETPILLLFTKMPFQLQNLDSAAVLKPMMLPQTNKKSKIFSE